VRFGAMKIFMAKKKQKTPTPIRSQLPTFRWPSIVHIRLYSGVGGVLST